jgi:hypothetical protein
LRVMRASFDLRYSDVLNEPEILFHSVVIGVLIISKLSDNVTRYVAHTNILFLCLGTTSRASIILMKVQLTKLIDRE